MEDGFWEKLVEQNNLLEKHQIEMEEMGTCDNCYRQAYLVHELYDGKHWVRLCSPECLTEYTGGIDVEDLIND